MVAKAGAQEGRAVTLQMRGVTVRFGALAALENVDLDLRSGKVMGLAGDNGAGKSTLLRSICGDVAASSGEIRLDGRRMVSTGARDPRVGMVWQRVELPENLDVSAALLLGSERRGLLGSGPKTYLRARALLNDLGLPIADPTRAVSTLTAAERQLLAVARAVTPWPRLLLLDEPTAVLNRVDSASVERLIRQFRDRGTTILLVSHDMEQLFRLADQVVVLRHGRVVTQIDPAQSHPDELLALMAGQDVAAVARRQLGRLQTLSSQLSAPGRGDSGGMGAEITLILSALGVALGTSRLSLHLLDGAVLRQVGSVGLPGSLMNNWQEVPLLGSDNPLAAAVAQNTVVDVGTNGESPVLYRRALKRSGVAAWWAVPFSNAGDVRGVIGVYRSQGGPPDRDELDLINLYAGYAAAALERERLLAKLTGRNRVLEAIRTVLQTLAGPAALDDGIVTVLDTLRNAVTADGIGLYVRSDDGVATVRAHAGSSGAEAQRRLADTAASVLEMSDNGHTLMHALAADGGSLTVRLSDTTVLVAAWATHLPDADERILLEDAAQSILLALERERTQLVRGEVVALLRAQELQRSFLARLSHELRTPLTAIHGYASSLLQTDVTWDAESEQRFLSRIIGESARLRRLVGDLLDFSMIESDMLRVRPDWVELPLVLDAAISCLLPSAAAVIQVDRTADVPAIWADHDRIEQMLVNLMDNAVRHNPPGTSVHVDLRPDRPEGTAGTEGTDGVIIEITDDGVGLPSHNPDGAGTQPAARSSASAGAGLGLRITEGIVEAHHGTIRGEPMHPGTRFVIRLPVEPAEPTMEAANA